MIDVQKKLAEDLNKIFNLKRVVFDVIGNNIEQDILICEIREDKSKYAKKGNQHVVISGVVGFRGQNVNNPLGYMKDRLAQAKNEDLQYFRFTNTTRKESTLFIGQSFATQTLEFTYTRDVPYDVVTKKIEFKDLIFRIFGKGN